MMFCSPLKDEIGGKRSANRLQLYQTSQRLTTTPNIYVDFTPRSILTKIERVCYTYSVEISNPAIPQGSSVAN